MDGWRRRSLPSSAPKEQMQKRSRFKRSETRLTRVRSREERTGSRELDILDWPWRDEQGVRFNAAYRSHVIIKTRALELWQTAYAHTQAFLLYLNYCNSVFVFKVVRIQIPQLKLIAKFLHLC